MNFGINPVRTFSNGNKFTTYSINKNHTITQVMDNENKLIYTREKTIEKKIVNNKIKTMITKKIIIPH